MVQKILGKATPPNEQRKKRKKHVWLPGRLHIEGRLNERPRLQRRRHGICKPNARRIQVRATCGWSTRASEPARARLHWAALSLVIPVTFGHTTACRSPALAFSAANHFAMKCSAPCSAVLCHSPSSWAAVVHWSALMPKALRSSRKHPILCHEGSSRLSQVLAYTTIFYRDANSVHLRTPLYRSSRFYAQNPVFEIAHQESVKVYDTSSYEKQLMIDGVFVQPV